MRNLYLRRIKQGILSQDETKEPSSSMNDLKSLLSISSIPLSKPSWPIGTFIFSAAPLNRRPKSLKQKIVTKINSFTYL